MGSQCVSVVRCRGGASSMLSLLIVPALLASGQVNAQFGQPTNANPFVDQMLEEGIKASNETIFLNEEQYVLVVDVFIFRPELQLEVFDGRMEGMKSLNRSSDAILTYSEDSGSPVFTIDSSLMLSNMSFKSGAKGQVAGLGFELLMPDIILDVLVENVDIATVIEVDIGDLSDIKPDVKDVRFRDVGHIDVEIIGLTPELDSFVSPITSVVINMVKRDLQNLVTPILKTLLTDVVRDNAPSDLSVLFG